MTSETPAMTAMPSAVVSDADVVLQTVGLTKTFSGFIAVNNLDLKIKRGSVHALIGPNGAGKTTVFNLLTNFLPPTAGKIYFNDEDITGMAPAEVARRGLVRSFQISAVFPSLTVINNIRIALQRPQGLATQCWRSDKILDRLDERCMQLIDSVGLSVYKNSIAGELSYGRKRALELATTLALDPEVLLLDEPMAGMGREDISRIATLIKAVSNGRTVVMVEHNLSVVADLCDRVTVLQRGEILAEGSYQEVSHNAAVREAYLGTEHE